MWPPPSRKTLKVEVLGCGRMWESAEGCWFAMERNFQAGGFPVKALIAWVDTKEPVAG